MYYFNGLVDVFVIDSLECHDIVDIDTSTLECLMLCYATFISVYFVYVRMAV